MSALSVTSSLCLASVAGTLYFTFRSCQYENCVLKDTTAGEMSTGSALVVNLAQKWLEMDWDDKKHIVMRCYECLLRSEAAVLSLVLAVWLASCAVAQFALRLALGELTAVEISNSYTRALHFLLAKVFQILYVIAAAEDGYHDFAVCVSWWGLTFPMMISMGLCQDRFNRLLQAHRLQQWQMAKIMMLLSAMMALLLAHAALWATAWRPHIDVVIAFELFSIPTYLIKGGKQLAKHCLHMAAVLQESSAASAAAAQDCDAAEEGDEEDGLSGWAAWQSSVNFYVDLAAGLSDHVLRLAHHLSLLWTFGFRFRIVDLVILLDIRARCRKLLESLHGYLLYCTAYHNIHHSFEDADKAAVDSCGGVCSICFSALSGSRASCKRLPCGHIFHLSCLLGWVQQNHNLVAANFTCPVCRNPLHLRPSGALEKGVLGVASRMLRLVRIAPIRFGLQIQAGSVGLEIVHDDGAVGANVVDVSDAPLPAQREGLAAQGPQQQGTQGRAFASGSAGVSLEGRVPHRLAPNSARRGVLDPLNPAQHERAGGRGSSPVDSLTRRPTVRSRLELESPGSARPRQPPPDATAGPPGGACRQGADAAGPSHARSGADAAARAADDAAPGDAAWGSRRARSSRAAAALQDEALSGDDASSIGAAISAPLAAVISSRLRRSAARAAGDGVVEDDADSARAPAAGRRRR